MCVGVDKSDFMLDIVGGIGIMVFINEGHLQQRENDMFSMISTIEEMRHAFDALVNVFNTDNQFMKPEIAMASNVIDEIEGFLDESEDDQAILESLKNSEYAFRISAPGYLDASDWVGIDNIEELEQCFETFYGDC